MSLATIGCGPSAPSAESLGLIDRDATAETRMLYANMQDLAPNHLLVGHHEANKYGVGWRATDSLFARSDLHDVTGSHPALFGFDFLAYKRGADSVDVTKRDRMRAAMIRAYEMGGINAICWHAHNPVSGGNSWDTTRAVAQILPGGTHHDVYRTMLDDVGSFLDTLYVESWGGLRKTRVPVLFRPFHEHNGSWFWWGEPHAEANDYVRLWQFTTSYLRDTLGVHNLLYVYSPDIFDERGNYLDRYPGDAYADVLGFDDYFDFRELGRQEGRSEAMFVDQIRTLTQLADERGKLAALTETGLEGIPDSTWFTRSLLGGLMTDSLTQRLSYVMLWRNAYEAGRTGHHYAPFPGHSSAPDFVAFRQDTTTLFLDDLPPLYTPR